MHLQRKQKPKMEKKSPRRRNSTQSRVYWLGQSTHAPTLPPLSTHGTFKFITGSNTTSCCDWLTEASQRLRPRLCLKLSASSYLPSGMVLSLDFGFACSDSVCYLPSITLLQGLSFAKLLQRMFHLSSIIPSSGYSSTSVHLGSKSASSCATSQCSGRYMLRCTT